MKIAIIGAGGVRTPLIVRSMAKRQAQLDLTELSLMDIDADHLELICALIDASEERPFFNFVMTKTTDVRLALTDADFVITTFRVGGMAARVIDEKVPLGFGILGQETTGSGGFAMGMRTIPVLTELVSIMQQVCPQAWLINFANPSGMLAEAVTKTTSWKKVVGICDAPSTMQRYAAAILKILPDQVYLDYFGLNHLGWVRRVEYLNHDYLPDFIQMMRHEGRMPGLPFDPEFIAGQGMIPNEYLYYYYHSKEAFQHILRKGQTRGEQIQSANSRLFSELGRLRDQKLNDRMLVTYEDYLKQRSQSYMETETNQSNADFEKSEIGQEFTSSGEGYAGVALDLIEGLIGTNPKVIILNGLNHGAIAGMADEDVVEIPMAVKQDFIQPLVVGTIPDHCLGLMKIIKEYEHLTISAAVEGSYSKAIQALTIHPLVADHDLAHLILDEYIKQHKGLFPQLN